METKVEPLGESGSLDQNKATFLSSWKTFAENTTLHGLKNTLNNNKRNSFRRLIWIFLLCFSTVSFGYSVATCWLRFTSFPIHTVITNEIGKPEDGMEFPAVTICNLNNVMKSKRDTADDDRRFTELGLNVSGCQETREVRGNMTCGQAIMCALYGLTMIPGCDNTTKQKLTKALMNSSMNEEEIYSKYGHDLFDLTSHLRRCEFRETEKKCTAKDFVSSITTDGLCFTYNSGLNNFSEPYRTKVAGPRLGLNILVDLQTNETTYKDESAIGLNVIIHAQRTFVNRLQGFNVMPGTHATIGVKLIKHERLPHPYPTNCTVTNLSGIYSYTQDACSFECVSKMVIEECGCRPAGLLGPTNVPVCPIVKKTCIDQAFVKRPKWLSECNCNSACTELEYESHVSYARFPDDTTIEVLQNHGINKSSHYMKNNFVFLQVGFQKLGYEKRKYEKSYVLQGLLGEIGGNMGLMLGCSYLTICEFLEFLWDIVISRMKKKLDAAAKPVTLDNNSN